MTHRAIAVIALAGIAPAAAAQLGTLNIRADQGHGGAYAISDTITWTVSITGISGWLLRGFDLNFDASDPTLGLSSPFDDTLSTPLISPVAGTPSGASILGVLGGQSPILDPLGTQQGDVVLGTFTTLVTGAGLLTFDISDGGANNLFSHVSVYNGSSTPSAFDGRPNVSSDTVYLGGAVPAPITLAPLALSGLMLTRRRR